MNEEAASVLGVDRVEGRAHRLYQSLVAPGRSEARKRAASKAARSRYGGQIGELRETLDTLYEEVRSGAVEPKRGAVLNQILNARIRLVETEMRVREQQELEARITELERRREWAS